VADAYRSPFESSPSGLTGETLLTSACFYGAKVAEQKDLAGARKSRQCVALHLAPPSHLVGPLLVVPLLAVRIESGLVVASCRGDSGEVYSLGYDPRAGVALHVPGTRALLAPARAPARHRRARMSRALEVELERHVLTRKRRRREECDELHNRDRCRHGRPPDRAGCGTFRPRGAFARSIPSQEAGPAAHPFVFFAARGRGAWRLRRSLPRLRTEHGLNRAPTFLLASGRAECSYGNEAAKEQPGRASGHSAGGVDLSAEAQSRRGEESRTPAEAFWVIFFAARPLAAFCCPRLARASPYASVGCIV
jgi:hypothetical protein